IGLECANRRELLGIITERLGAVVRVVDFAHQAGMRDGNVVALEIVVDVDLPVAVDDVVPALGEMESFELEAARLLRDLAEESAERLSAHVEIHEDKLFPNFAA